MSTMIWYELKKMLSRKTVQLFFLLVAALILVQQISPIRDALSGYARGMREVYGRYEGQTITEALQKQAAADYAEFALSHSEYFNTLYDEGQNTVSYSAKVGGYYGGVAQAYDELIFGESVESLQRTREGQAEGNRKGAPVTPTAQYLGGWSALGRTMGDGMFALFLLVLGLLPVYAQEGTSRMEGVLLSSAKRGRASAAKALAAVVFALLVALLVYGMETLVIALTYGLSGASTPVSALSHWSQQSTLTIGEYYTLAGLTVVAAVTASAALVALASSLFRQPVAALITAAALIAAQFLLVIAAGNSPASQIYMNLLPAPALASPWSWLDSLLDAKYAAFALIFPALLSIFLFCLAPRCFLRRRKA